MSEENVEVARRLYPGVLDWVALVSDPEGLGALRPVIEAVVLPDFETVTVPGQVPLSGAAAEDSSRPTVYGIDGFLSAFRDWLSAWESWVVTATDLIEAGGDRVLVLLDVRARSKTHEVEMPIEAASLLTISDGRVSRMELFFDRAQALEAAGLSEQAMSQENVELAHRAFDAINRRDFGALLTLMDDDVEVVSRIVAVEGSLHGHDGMRRWWENWFSVFPDYNIEVVDLTSRGDLIVAALRALGHGAGSDVPFEDSIWLASRWRRGKCVWWRTFNTREEALEAAGLTE